MVQLFMILIIFLIKGLKMNKIKKDLKEIKLYFENKECLDKYYEMYPGVDNTVQQRAQSFGMCIACAPVHIQEIYIELYVNHKTVFQLSHEKYCSEQYLTKRKQEMFNYLYAHKDKIYP